MVMLNKTAEPRRFLLIAEVAEEARVTTKTVRKWIAAGRLRAGRIGSVIRVDRAELERLLAGRAAGN
jgi:excisionase family DNA binding protein